MSVTYIVSPASGDSYATVFSDSGLKNKIGTLQKGAVRTVLSSTSNAYKINFSSGNSGTATSGTVKSNSGLNARNGPGTSYDKVGAFNNGASVTIHEVQNGWMKVSGSNGWGTLKNVWVSSQYIKTSSNSNEGWVSKTDIKATTTQTNDSQIDAETQWRSSTQYAEAQLRAKNDETFVNYAYSKEKRYLGTEDHYKEMMSKLNYCFGTPPKFNMDIDIQYVSDIGLGRVMSQTYYANPTLLSICPGKVKMFPHLFNKNERENVFTAIKDAAYGDESARQKIEADKNTDALNGSLYEFSQDTEDYAKRVNLLCRACAVLLGIGDSKMPYTSSKLVNFDYAYWSIRKKYSPSTGKKQNVFTDFWKGGYEALTSGITDQNYIHFLVNNENTTVQDTISTEVGESFLQGILGTTNEVATELSYLAGIGFNNQMDAKDNINNILNGVIGVNGWTKMVDNVLSGGKLKIPQIVKDTNYSQSISCSMNFVSPYGDPKAVFLWCIVPICHLLAFALPKQLSDTMYSYPYVLKVNQKGWFNSNLAVMTSINIVRGGNDNTSWSSQGLSTEWTVNFEITPLYSQLTMPSTDHPFLFMKNDGLIDYLGNLCGFDLKANNLDVKIKLLTSFIQNRFTGIPNDIQRWTSDKVSNAVSKIFNM